MAKKKFSDLEIMMLFEGPPPFHPNPPQGGGGSGKGGPKGTDALNEARQAQGKPAEGKGDGKPKKGKSKAAEKQGKSKAAEKQESGEGGRVEIELDFETIEERIARERDERRKRYG